VPSASGSHVSRINAKSPDDIRIPACLTFHLIDIYLEELDKVLMPPTTPQQPVPMSIILFPIFILLARTSSKSTRTHLQSNLLDPLLNALTPSNASNNKNVPRKRPRLEFEPPTYSNIIANACLTDPEKEGRADIDTVRNGLLRRLFEIAGEEGIKSANRKLMFALYRKNVDADGDAE
jgi:ribosomal RNA-processing protein 1